MEKDFENLDLYAGRFAGVHGYTFVQLFPTLAQSAAHIHLLFATGKSCFLTPMHYFWSFPSVLIIQWAPPDHIALQLPRSIADQLREL